MDEFLDEKQSLAEAVRTFDAFPKTRVTYTTRSSKGGAITLFLVAACLWLAWGEIGQFMDGVSVQQFSLQEGEGHDMQINVDITVAMPCDSIDVNVQDAAGDQVLAGKMLQKTPANFDAAETHQLYLNTGKRKRRSRQEGPNAGAVVRKAGRKKKFNKGPKAAAGAASSCRVWGSMNVNRVLGDFHITAKGHGYYDGGKHVDHDTFNFSHVVRELSFGEYYPKLVNPMDGVVATTEEKFYKFQYFLSVVPTTYIAKERTIKTNQYSVTEQDRKTIPQNVPGIFFKFDIEPISLTITDSRTPLLPFLIRLANIVGGVMVAGGWFYHFSDTFINALFPGRKRSRPDGFLNGRPAYFEDADED